LQYPSASAAVKQAALPSAKGGGEPDCLFMELEGNRVPTGGVDINHPGPLMEDELSGHRDPDLGGRWDPGKRED
jgi:hypothetical protein